MLSLPQEKLRAHDAPRNIELHHGDASHTTLPDESVDLVLAANVWHELQDHGSALQEAARILVPGGRLAVLDWRADLGSPPGPPQDHRLGAAEVQRFMTDSGWIALLPVNIGTYSYLITASLARREDV